MSLPALLVPRNGVQQIVTTDRRYHTQETRDTQVAFCLRALTQCTRLVHASAVGRLNTTIPSGRSKKQSRNPRLTAAQQSCEQSTDVFDELILGVVSKSRTGHGDTNETD